MSIETDSAFYRGFCRALADLVRFYDQPTMAKRIMEANGVDLDDFSEANHPVTPDDLATLRTALKR